MKAGIHVYNCKVKSLVFWNWRSNLHKIVMFFVKLGVFLFLKVLIFLILSRVLWTFAFESLENTSKINDGYSNPLEYDKHL